jgi:hypothetical protein
LSAPKKQISATSAERIPFDPIPTVDVFLALRGGEQFAKAPLALKGMRNNGIQIGAVRVAKDGN